jgi:hypothetical protein
MSFSEAHHVFIFEHYVTLNSYLAYQTDFMCEFSVLDRLTVFQSINFFSDTGSVND